jgi:predicted GNAT family N-acyltransferase
METHQKEENQFTLRWLDYSENLHIITKLRKQVFSEEQKLGDFLVAGDDDPDGIHLGMFEGEHLISIISLYIFEKGHPKLQLYNIAGVENRAVQFGRRVEIPKYRKNRFAAFLVAVAYKSLYELIQFDAVFFLMYGIHRQLAPIYRRLYLTQNQYDVQTEHGNALMLLQDSPEIFARGYIMQRYLVEKYTKEYGFIIPSLKEHILKHTNLKQILSKAKPDKNIYLEAMSIADEMPRLSAQSRLLFMSNKKYFSAIAEPENGLHILDAGCGPGVFLSSLSQLPNLSKSHFTGIDLSEIMITYASLTNPKLKWITGNVYELPFESK